MVLHIYGLWYEAQIFSLLWLLRLHIRCKSVQTPWKKKNEIRRWYHFNDKNRRHTKYRSQKQKACMKENLSERYASLCNTNNFYQMESSELAFPPKICISDWRHAGHHLVVHVLSHGPIQNIFPGRGGGGVCEEYLSFPGGSKIFSVCVILYYVNLTNLNFPGEGGGGSQPLTQTPARSAHVYCKTWGWERGGDLY